MGVKQLSESVRQSPISPRVATKSDLSKGPERPTLEISGGLWERLPKGTAPPGRSRGKRQCLGVRQTIYWNAPAGRYPCIPPAVADAPAGFSAWGRTAGPG